MEIKLQLVIVPTIAHTSHLASRLVEELTTEDKRDREKYPTGHLVEVGDGEDDEERKRKGCWTKVHLNIFPAAGRTAGLASGVKVKVR